MSYHLFINEKSKSTFYTHRLNGNRSPDPNIKNENLINYINNETDLDSAGKEYMINLVRSKNTENREKARNILANLKDDEKNTLYVNQSGRFDQILIRQRDGLFKNGMWLIEYS